MPVAIVSGPLIEFIVSGDSTFVVISVVASDSQLHASWSPSAAVVETSAGFQRAELLAPEHCLTEIDAGNAYPYTYSWTSCAEIAVVTRVALSASRQAKLAALVSGRIVQGRTFTTMPGAEYIVRVPVGRAAVAEAIRRAAGFSDVLSAGVLQNDPTCVSSDAVPPPPCPPWRLSTVLVATHGESGPNEIKVSTGGWIRVDYVDAASALHTVQSTIPP